MSCYKLSRFVFYECAIIRGRVRTSGVREGFELAPDVSRIVTHDVGQPAINEGPCYPLGSPVKQTLLAYLYCPSSPSGSFTISNRSQNSPAPSEHGVPDKYTSRRLAGGVSESYAPRAPLCLFELS